MITRPASTVFACAALALTSVAAAQPGVEPLTRQQILTGAQINRPVVITHAPGDHSRLFIVEQKPVTSTGRVRIYDRNAGQLLATPFITISGIATANNEQGLLGLAFHPNYAENGHFFVYFSTSNTQTNVRRYTVSSTDPNVADTSTLKQIINIPSTQGNHNGGWIGFGPDGYLYIATGDGGGAGDSGNNAQNLNDLRGKMLRINIDVEPQGYALPPDNPFINVGGVRREVWAYGLRNPWRTSFDRDTGDLYIGDVGQNLWEEVNFQHADSAGGENYGWKCYEGNNNFAAANCPGSPALSWPFHVYGISGNARCAVIGGYVYRGCDIPTLNGHYFFADYCPGHVFSIIYDRDGNVPAPSPSPPPSHPVTAFTDHSNNLGAGISQLSSFGQDADGEIYIATLFSGVYKIVPQNPTVSHADLNCDGSVGVPDLLLLLEQWGPCLGCKADLTGNGSVGVADLLELLGEWG